MSALVHVLTALIALVVLLTRIRMRRGASGRAATSSTWLTVHTLSGLLGTLVWVVFLVAPDDSFPGSSLVGIVGLFFYWLVAAAGVVLTLRWLPSKGRHAGDASEDRWSQGPLLSVAAHAGVLLAVGVLTWAYLVRVV